MPAGSSPGLLDHLPYRTGTRESLVRRWATARNLLHPCCRHGAGPAARTGSQPTGRPPAWGRVGWDRPVARTSVASAPVGCRLVLEPEAVLHVGGRLSWKSDEAVKTTRGSAPCRRSSRSDRASPTRRSFAPLCAAAHPRMAHPGLECYCPATELERRLNHVGQSTETQAVRMSVEPWHAF